MTETYLCPQLRTKKNVSLDITTKCIKKYPLHWHDYFEIEVITKGSGVHILNGKRYQLSAGSAYLLKPTDYHEIISDEDIEIHNVTFREDMLNEATLLSILHSDQRKLLTLEGELLQTVMMGVKLLHTEWKNGGEYQRQLLEYLIHFFVDKKGGKMNHQQLTGIKKALVYLEFHFREPIRLSTLAKEAGFNTSYFSELFKQTTGESFTEKLNGLRLEYACTLLSNNYSVSYACFESGFGSLSNFFTAFKKKYGVSPSEYAKAPR